MPNVEEQMIQINLLKYDLQKLRDLVENFKNLAQNGINTELSKEKQRAKDLKKKVDDLKEKHIAAKTLMCEVQNKHNEVEQESNADDIAQNLQDFESLVGYKNCCYESVENDENSIMITLEYNEYCYVKLIRNALWQYSIHQISPEHPNIKQLSDSLQETQDIKGFLCNLRKYFKFVMAYKTTIEKNV